MAEKTVSIKTLYLRNDARDQFVTTKVYGKGEPVVVWETDGSARFYIGDGKTEFQNLVGMNLSKADAEKLAGIAAGAQVNVIESVKVNGAALTVTDKGIDITVPTGALADKDKVAEADLDDTLKEKVNAAAKGNHAHENKTVLDGITAEKVAAWDKVSEKAAQTDLDTVAGKVDTLIGTDTGKSARTIANEELAKQLIPENASEALDTLGEIATWIQAHPNDAAAMNNKIAAIEAILAGIGGEDESATVVAYVTSVIDALKIGDYAKVADLTDAVGRIKALEDVGATKVEASEANGNIKVDGVETKVYELPVTVLDSGDTLIIDCGGANT